MAGDWMKVEKVTPEKPEVLAIASTLQIDPDAVFGKLFRIWCWFDDHTLNGNAPCVTSALLDRKACVTGFAQAMSAVGWLTETSDGLLLPNFDRHNGETAKQRALTAKRVRKSKEKSNAEGNGKVTNEALPREEKRRVLIAPAHAAEILEATKKANELLRTFGEASTDRDRRLIWGACLFSQHRELGEDWLAVGLRETKENRPNNKFAYLRKVLSESAGRLNIDFAASIASIDVPERKKPGQKQKV